jgi:hypothetical protein
MSFVLLGAAAYNVLWGAAVIIFPLVPFEWAGMEPPRYPELWQCIGMIVGVYGVGDAVAAVDPARHWPIVLVGLLGKIFGPIGFAVSLIRETLPVVAGWTIVTNDLVWWIPFILILRHAFRARAELCVEKLDTSQLSQIPAA